MTAEQGPSGLTGHPTHEGRRERIAALLRGTLDGHREDLDQIVAELTPLLWRVARSTGLDATTSEDVVQTTWLALLRHLDTIRTPEALIGWLVKVARRESVRLLTADGRTRPVPAEMLEPLPDSGPGVADTVVTDERRAVLWRAIRRLPVRCQHLMQVIAFSDRPDYEAISAAMGMPKGSIGPTRGRCLARLRAILQAEPGWSLS